MCDHEKEKTEMDETDSGSGCIVGAWGRRKTFFREHLGDELLLTDKNGKRYATLERMENEF